MICIRLLIPYQYIHTHRAPRHYLGQAPVFFAPISRLLQVTSTSKSTILTAARINRHRFLRRVLGPVLNVPPSPMPRPSPPTLSPFPSFAALPALSPHLPGATCRGHHVVVLVAKVLPLGQGAEGEVILGVDLPCRRVDV